MISILLVEDDPLLCTLLEDALTAQADLRVAGTVRSGLEVVGAVERLRPQLVLLDCRLPGLSGLEVLEKLAALPESPPVLMLTAEEDEETALEAARRGARGFIGKSAAVPGLPQAIRTVLDGGVWFSPEVLRRIVGEYPRLVRRVREQEGPAALLSEREKEVLIALARGRTNEQIAGELYMSLSSVKTHIRRIFEKLNLSNRTEAAAFAVKEGLLR